MTFVALCPLTEQRIRQLHSDNGHLGVGRIKAEITTIVQFSTTVARRGLRDRKDTNTDIVFS